MKRQLSWKSFLLIAFIIFASYRIYTGIDDVTEKSKKELVGNGWYKGDEETLIEKCIEDSGEMAMKHPLLTKEYCACSFEKIMRNFNREEYLTIKDKSNEEQVKILGDSFRKCYDVYIKSINDKNLIVN